MDSQYMVEPGVVKKIDDGRAVISIKPESTETCGACCACSMFANKDFELTVPDRGFKEGQRVTVKVPKTSRLLSVLLLFVLPLAGFAVGAVAGSAIRIEGVEQSAGAVIGAIVGFLLAMLVAYYVNKTVSKNRPVVVEPADEERGPQS